VKLFFLLLALALPSQTLFASNIRDFFQPPAPKVQWRGYTGSSYNGSTVGGPVGASAKCEAAFAGSHPCLAEELFKLGTAYPGTQTAWVIDGYRASAYRATPDVGYSSPNWPGQSTFLYSLSFTNYNNCNGWNTTNPDHRGAVMSGLTITSSACDFSFRLPCCE